MTTRPPGAARTQLSAQHASVESLCLDALGDARNQVTWLLELEADAALAALHARQIMPSLGHQIVIECLHADHPCDQRCQQRDQQRTHQLAACAS